MQTWSADTIRSEWQRANKMKKKAKETILETLAIMLICATFVVTAVLVGYLMRMNFVIESEMPSMQSEICD